jgi:predicted heme/steroid binding protein
MYTGITTNDSVQTALQKIDAKFGDAMVGYTFTNGVYQSVVGAPVGLGGNLTTDISIGGNYTLTFTGNVRAAKHITTGGNASQFVKGDGTLDGTAYQAAGNYITALTGDVIAAGPGSVNASLAVVNSNPGTYGSGTRIPVVTVDTKGRVTALTTTAIVVPSGILSFVGDVYGSGVTGSQTTLTLSDVNTNVYTVNSFLKFKVNAKGQVTGAAPITHVDLEAVLGYVPTPETRKLSINGVQHDLQSDIYWDIATGVSNVTASAPLVSSGGATPNISIPKADASTDGYLDNVDWVTFNNKVPTSRTLTINGVTYDLSANRSWSIDSMIYPGAGIAVSTGTGWGTSLVDNSTNWNTAYTERISSSSSPLSILNHVISIAQATTAADGYLSATDWNIFNNKQPAGSYVTTSRTINTTGPLQGGGDLSADRTLSIIQAGASTDGYLSSTDWTTFNNKQGAGNYITALTGEATATGPGSVAITLSTPAVTGKLLTGVNITGGSVVATDTILEAFGKVQNQINGLVGGSIYKGTWNASTNTPTLTSGVGTTGWYYIVSVPGTTNIDGITDWNLGDWIIFDGTAWQQVDNTDAVVSVNGYTGAVSLVSSDVPEGLTNLYYTPARARTAISLTTTGTSGAATYNSTTGVLNVPIYTPDLSGYVPTTRTLTINGTAYDLSANRSWTVSGTMPAGGTAGQILSKIDATDYNTQWIDNFSSQVKNVVKLGAALTKGTPVYVSSADGTNMIVSASSNTTEAGSSKTFGLLETGGALNAQVECVTYGLITGLDTSAAGAAGDPVWLGPNGTLLYGLANKPVAPAHMVYIGVVTRKQSNNGEIFVNIQNGFEVNELHDVLITAPPTDGQGLFLQTLAGTQLWRNRSIADVLGYTPANDANVVKLTGDQTVAGIKTMSNIFKLDDTLQIKNIGQVSINTGYTGVWAETGAIGFYTGANAIRLLYAGNYNYTMPAADGTLALTSQLSSYVPTSRTLTINGTTYDLSANRSWTIASGVTSFNTRTGAITLTSGDVTGALGYTPYNSTNPSGYITSSGSISGSSGSVIGLTLTSSANGINPDNVTQNQIGYNTSVSLFGQTDGGLYSSAYSSSWIHQIYGDFRTGQIAIRGKNSGTWQAWRTVLDSSNYTSYSPSLTGGGASGTWGISISGNAATATTASNSTQWGGYNLPTRTNWQSRSAGDIVVGQLSWKNYGNNHTIFDASAGTSPDGTSISNTNPNAANWSPSYPTLMGWNGAGTYGVRVDTARYAESASNSTSLGGYDSSTYLGKFGNSYYQANTWIQVNAATGMYWPSYYGLHIYPNMDGSYGSMQVNGRKNSWAGIHFNDSGMHLMMNENESGHYKGGYGWQFRWYNGTLYCSKNANGGGTEGVVLDSSNSSYAYNMNQYVRTSDGPTFQTIYINDWARIRYESGVYFESYSAGLRAAYQASFGQVATYGTARGGHGGYVIVNNYVTNLMQDTSGNFGFFSNDDWAWRLFYNRGNNCWGIGTDNTYSGDGFRCVKYGSAEYGWTTWSDRRAKENISSITNALDKVLAMRGVYYNYIKDEAKSQHVGFIAQELMDVLPQSVRYAEEIDEYNINYGPIVSVLAEAIKEQQNEINELKLLVNQLLTK